MLRLFLIMSVGLWAQAPAPKAKAPVPATPAKAAAPKAAQPAAAAAPEAASGLATDDQKTIYALGLSMYRSLAQFELTPAELEIVKRALADAANNKPAIDINTWGPKIETLARARGARVAERQKTLSKAYLDKAAAEPGATKSATGLIYREVKAGAGASPKATDNVKVHYRGTLVDGTEFDSSYKRNEPASFPLNGVIKCWTEGVQKMKVGGKSVLVCPSDLAYGDNGRPSIPGGATLIFEIELLGIGGA